MKKETKRLEFKSKFTPTSTGDWCELIKDMIAMANSGGGEILIGLSDDGRPSGEDVNQVLRADAADFNNKIERYIGTTAPDILVKREEENGHVLARIVVGESKFPLVFVKEGGYVAPDGRQKMAFAKGTVYFRHGPKSEPAMPRDFEEFINKELKRRRRELFGNMKKVISAPIGSQVVVLPLSSTVAKDESPGYRPSDEPGAIPVRGLVDDSPYKSIREELTGVVKAWKTDSLAFAPESQLWRFYQNRRSLKLDNVDRTCLLKSAAHMGAPFFYWAVGLPKDLLITATKQMSFERYPGPNVAARLAHAIGGEDGKALLRGLTGSNYLSAQNLAAKLVQTVDEEDRIVRVYGSLEVNLEETERLCDMLLAPDQKIDKQKIKRVDTRLYAPQLKDVK